MKHLNATYLGRPAIILLLSLFALPVFAQNGYQIRVKVNGLSYDTLWFGHTFGKRVIMENFALRQPDGWYELKTDESIPTDMYAIIYKRAKNAPKQSLQCILPDNERTFSIEANIDKPYLTPKVTGSEENQKLYQYIRGLDPLLDMRDSLCEEMRDLQNETAFKAWVKSEEALESFQRQTMEQNPNTLLAKVIAASIYKTPPPPNPKDPWGKQYRDRWQWYRQHYFDHMDPAGTQQMRYLQCVERLDFFVYRLTPPDPDSLISVSEQVVRLLKPNEEHYKYYFNYMINSLGARSKFRTDEAWVYLVKNYVMAGKTPWTKPEELEKMSGDAARMEPLFVGKTAPKLSLVDRKDQPVELDNIKTPFVLLVFWNPDCSHCKKELPIIKKMFESYKDRGLTVLSVCGKKGDDLPLCWDFVDAQTFPPEWIVAADKTGKSRMASAFNLRSFPKIFLLDAQKKILYKRNGEVPEIELTRILDKFLVR